MNSPEGMPILFITVDFSDEQLDQLESLLASLIKLDEVAA
jgi:hypothetical protein